MAVSDDIARQVPQPSGRFVLRLAPGLHALLRRAAADEGLSLNEYCARKLAAPGAPPIEGLGAAVERAAALFGPDVIGIAVFGSWVRGEASGRSDVDLLVVLEDRIPLGRSLYRRWDDAPLTLEARRVEPQFVHLAGAAGAEASGLWAEVALDGIVLFERGLRLSKRLVGVRHQIAAGRIERRFAYGQPYWVGKRTR